MMDELKQQFYEVMHKYQKPFSEEGVTANLTQWYEQKQGLLQLLRRHPLWNEKELAIVFRVEERREIDRITVDETRAAILELGRRACTDDTVYENFETALRAATADYARIPNEYRLDTIRQYGGIKCAPGQKASRIINRLCLKFHLDQIEEEAEAGEPDNRYMRTVKPYNALFARLADALNPAHIEKTAVLSIHPCDFLEMSNRDNTWSSCHCLEGGGYRGGCQSYMGDAVSMIFFTVSDEYTQDFHTAPRITREIFCYKIMFCCNPDCILQIWRTKRHCIAASSSRQSQHALTSRTCGHLSVEKIANLTASLRRTATIIQTMSMGMR